MTTKAKKLAVGLAICAASVASWAATTYPVKHGDVVAGESVKMEEGGGRIFYPASVGGTLTSAEYGPVVSTAKVNGLGLHVRSSLVTAPRDKKTWLYIDSNGKAYLAAYDMLAADPGFQTSLTAKPVLLDLAKYPELTSATRVFSTYAGSTANASYYLVGTKLYRTTALKKGAANSSTSVLMTDGASTVVGVDDGVFANTSEGIVFYRADGSQVGLSSVLGSSLTSEEVDSITAIHASYYVIRRSNGDQIIFKNDGSYSKTITGTNKGSFVSYYSRSAQVDGHNGQTTFAWWDNADYVLSYIDPYASEASAVKTISWVGMSGTKTTRANVVKLLSVSEDGFVQFTGKNTAGTSFYFHITGNLANLGSIQTITSTIASDATDASASSVAWNNPSNPLWHYKVPPASFGSSGSKSYYWRQALSATTGKYSLTRTNTAVQVKSYSGGGRVCTIGSNTNFLVPRSETQTGTGTGNQTISGPSNACGTNGFTQDHADAANLVGGLVPVGVSDLSYISTSGTFARNSSYKNLASEGAPPTVSGALTVPGDFVGSTGWDAHHSMMFGVGSNGLAYVGGEVFGTGVGSASAIPIPIAKDFLASTTGEISPTTVTIEWNDPRDARMNASVWNVKTSRLQSSTVHDENVLAGSVGSRQFSINAQTDGYGQTFQAEADIVLPVVGQRGAVLNVKATNFEGSIARPPVLNAQATLNVASNSAEQEVTTSVSDPDANETITLSVFGQATNGVVTLNEGKFYYRPNADYFGSDAFTLRATDKFGLTSDKSVSVAVNCPAPVMSGLSLASNRVGPYTGSTATLQYNANSCNGVLSAEYKVKRNSDGQVVNSKTETLTSGASQTGSYVFSDIAPGFYSVQVDITSATVPALNQNVVASGGLRVDPIGTPSLSTSKPSMTEDDFAVISVSGVDNCTLYSTVAEARINKGCHAEWSKSAGVHTLEKVSPSSVKMGGLRGGQQVSVVVSAYNTDGSSTAMSGGTWNVTIAPAVDVSIQASFAKGGSHRQYVDKVVANLNGVPENLCTVVGNNAEAAAVVDAGGKACKLVIGSLPVGMSNNPGTREVRGRIIDVSSNKIPYSVYRYISSTNEFLINSGEVTVPVVGSAFTSSVSKSEIDVGGKAGYSAKLSITGSANLVAAADANDAATTWASLDAPKFLVDWTSYPQGLTPFASGGDAGVAGSPLMSGDQSLSYRAYLLDDLGTQYEVAAGVATVDRAPGINVDAGPREISAEAPFTEVTGVQYTDADVGDSVVLSVAVQPSFGVANVGAGKVRYKPNSGYVGPDTIKVQATDKFGAYTQADVGVQVMCSLPVNGSFGKASAGASLANKPMNFSATYGPVLPCHGGYNTKVEFLDAGSGLVVQTVNAATSSISVLQGDSTYSNQETFNGVALQVGSYNTRITVESKADTTKKVVFTGQQLSVLPLVSPSLTADKTSFGEEEESVVSAGAISGCSYFSTVAEARANEGCHIEWNYGAAVKEFTKIGNNSAKLSATEGALNVTAKIKSYNTDGSFYELPDASIGLNVSKAANVILTPAFSKAGAYKQLVDKVNFSVASPSAACSLNTSLPSATSAASAGQKSCLVEFPRIASGISRNELNFSGRLNNGGVQDVEYRVSRVYSDGSVSLINIGSFVIPSSAFAPVTTMNVAPITVIGKKGYEASLSIADGAWSCIQTNNLTTASNAWAGEGELACLVEWFDLAPGIGVNASGGSVKASGVPSEVGNQFASYNVVMIGANGERIAVAAEPNNLISAAPAMTGDSTIASKPNGGAKALGGFSVSDTDIGDVVVVGLGVDAAHGNVVASNSSVTYSPDNGYMGSDSFTLKATDKLGAYTTKVVSVNVECSMPTTGNVAVNGGSTKLIGRPVEFGATFSPADSCNSGFQTTLQVVNNANGNVVREVQVPTNVEGGVDVMGNENVAMTFGNYSFTAGSYSTRLRVVSNAYPERNFMITGENFVVNNFSAPVITSSNAAPTEDDTITVVASNVACSSFVDTAEAARTTANSCIVEWSKTGAVSEMTVTGNDRISVKGNRGNGSVSAVLKVADTEGSIMTVASGNLLLNFNAGTTAPEIKFLMNKASYSVMRDYVNASIEVGSSGLQCTLVGSMSEGVAAAQSGAKVCLLNVTSLPSGIEKSPVGMYFNGRFTNTDSKTFGYSVSRVFSDGSTFDFPSGNFVANVAAAGLEAVVQSSRPSYIAGVQDGVVTLRLNNVSSGTTGCLQTTLESEAAATWMSDTTPKCLVSWTSVPTGMSIDPTNGLRLVGVPTTPAENLVGYKVEMVDASNNKHQVMSGSDRILVVQTSAPTFDIVPAYGYFLPSDGSQRALLVKGDGLAGVGTFEGADFAPLTMYVTDSIGAAGRTTEVPSMSSGSTQNIVVSNQGTSAWSIRNATMFVGYAGHGNTLSNTSGIKLMRVPDTTVVQLVVPKSAVDTSTVSIKVKVGSNGRNNILGYSQVENGLWNAYLAEKIGETLLPLTAAQAVNSNDGTSTFDGLAPDSVKGKTIVGVATPVIPGGEIRDYVFDVKSTPVVVALLPGGEIPASITSTKTSGSIPFGTRFDVTMDAQYRDDVKSITYEYSLNGGDWVLMSGISGFGGIYTFQDGGVYNVRAVITNKNTLAISMTDEVILTVKQTLKLNLTNNMLALPGTSVEMVASATKPDGQPVSYVTEWEIRRQGLAMETLTNQSSVTLTSENSQVINVLVKARPTELPAEDPLSWVSVSRTVTFAMPDKPRVSVTGPTTIEAGAPQDFVVKIVPTWPATSTTTMTVAGNWILPDGTLVPGSANLNWAPSADTVVSGGEVMLLKYQAWVVGAESTSTVTVEKKVYIKKYEFPEFKLVVKADTTYAPAYVSMAVMPSTTNDSKLMMGKKFTYSWTLPEGMAGKVTANKFTGAIDMPGTYAASVKVEDERGNEQVMDSSFEIVESRPYSLTLKTTLAQKFDRAPATYSLKLEQMGGHPKDRVKSYKVYVGETMVLDSGTRMPRLVTITTPGEHVIKVTLESNLGAFIEATATVTVGENQPPACTTTETWDSRGRYVAVKSSCKDPDGLIKKYQWYVNDVLQEKKTGTSLVWSPADGVTSATIRVVVTDDSGATGTSERTVTKP